jgi:hypothetical protein
VKADEQDSIFIRATPDSANTNSLTIYNSDSISNDVFTDLTIHSALGGVSNIVTTGGQSDFRTDFRTYEIRRIDGNASFYQDDVLIRSETNATYLPTVDLGIMLQVWDSSQESTLWCDWAFVRKYVANPPTYAFGSEENAPVTGYLDITDYKTESWTISKSVADALWMMSTWIDKHVVPAFFATIQATAEDHNGDPHTPFVGIIPATDYTLAAAADKASLIGYDHGWYLTVQYVPSDERTTEEDTNPSDTITALLGGTAWATTAGIEPHRISTVADWTNIKKAFEFTDRCTRWKAIQEICDYCHFVFVVKWRDVSGTWRPSAYFVHEDDIDSATIGLDIPASVTITDPDAHLLDGISVKDSPEHQYNRVLATGYDAATATHFYATAQTTEVSAGTEIPIEYVIGDAALNTQAKTDARAQELLDFFQASAKVYVARFKRRMDLELYQKISFSGYNKIDTDEMRITRILYSRSAANDVVEIEFSKDQAIQQLRRLARAVNPDYVAGTLGMINTDLSDVGLIDVFDSPIAGGTAAADLWEVPAALRPTDVVMAQTLMLDVRGMGIYNVCSISGRRSADIGFWGWDTENESSTEFARWRNYTTGEDIHTYLEIKRDIYINNDSTYPKIYFDVDSFRPTYIQGVRSPGSLQTLDFYAGGDMMLRLINYEGANPDVIGCYANMLLTQKLIAGGRIEGDGNNNLVFWDNATGQKTLSELVAGGGGLTNPMTQYLDMGGYSIVSCDDLNCDDIDCDDIDCDDLLAGGTISVWEHIKMKEHGFSIYWPGYERILADGSGALHIYPASGSDTVYIHGNLHVYGSTS